MTFLATVPDGSTIIFPLNGCYAQDKTIALRDRRHLIIDGNGSTFKRITPPNPTNPPAANTHNANWRILRGDTITLQNMTIRGNYVPSRRGSPGQGQYTDQGVSIWAGLNDTIQNVSIYNTDGEFIEADPDVERANGGDYANFAPSRNIVVDHLHGEHAGRQCVATTAVDGFTMSNSFIGDCQETGFDGEIDTLGELNRNIHLIANTFGPVYFSAIVVPVLSLPGFDGQIANVEIEGNKMMYPPDTCYSSILIGADGRGGLDGLNIRDNTLLTIGDGIALGSPKVHGVIDNNVIIKTTDNRGCDNPNLDPPAATPVRLRGSSVTVLRTAASGY